MVGRTPEYLGKKIQAREIKLVTLGTLLTPLIVLLSAGAASATTLGKRSVYAGVNPSGFSETLYAYLSQANNNGSAWAGYTGFVQPHAPGSVGAYGITFADLLSGAVMVTARFAPIIFVLAVAGALAGRPGHHADRQPDLRLPADRRRDPGRRPHLLPGDPARPGRQRPQRKAVLMAGLRRDLLTAAIAIVAVTIVFGLAYPLVITGIAQVVFPGSANGSKVSYRGHVVGSKLIGQEFKGKAHFQSRPSATGYSGDVTYFGNGGPNSTEVREEIREALAAYVRLNKPYDHSLTREDVPVDAVTQSASGVDPQISEANARIQAHRVAAVRRLSLSKVD